ncbi:DUF5709 domain-containing protein [Williamsia sp. MIQD14]|uniref:DUF5709 domain-containing protein n=1 Tax=Williamsia herbipolensis TaxID=1603258 RepID=A0AAU4JZG3_9NOCA|nr:MULTISPECIES: DUF5709 domain-containing protein [Williamsia]KQS00229.1 hypothetical protein ASG12_04615 [Williamsia sp. Leaf354]MCX6468328.1 DUF5709 domain-containing protein [Mycobacteriales bacterium]
MSDDVESISEGSDNEYSYDSDDQLQPEDTLVDRGVDDILDEGISPPEKPSKAMRYGVTAEDQREGESLEEHLAEEVPDPAAEVTFHEDSAPKPAVPADEDLSDAVDEIDEFDNEVGDDRAGRLVSPDEGVNPHTTHQEVASDAGIDGAGASAEEAAVHTVPEGQIP